MSTSLVPAEDTVRVAVKTPLMPEAASLFLPKEMTVAQALEQLASAPSREGNDNRVCQQIAREISGAYDILVVTQAGQVVKIKPTTTLQEIAVPREVRTSTGLKVYPAAAFEVQSYAAVGRAQPC